MDAPDAERAIRRGDNPQVDVLPDGEKLSIFTLLRTVPRNSGMGNAHMAAYP